jgi:hypothetical protein
MPSSALLRLFMMINVKLKAHVKYVNFGKCEPKKKFI